MHPLHPHHPHHHPRREFGDGMAGRGREDEGVRGGRGGGQAPSDLLQMTYDEYLERFGQLRQVQGGGGVPAAAAKAAAAGAGGSGGKENAAGGLGGGEGAAAAPTINNNVQQMSEEEYVLYCQRCVCPSSPPVWVCGAWSSCCRHSSKGIHVRAMQILSADGHAV